MSDDLTITPQDDLTIRPQARPEFAFEIRDENGELLLGLRYDGTTKTGPSHNPDEEARLLWEAIAPHLQEKYGTPCTDCPCAPKDEPASP